MAIIFVIRIMTPYSWARIMISELPSASDFVYTHTTAFGILFLTFIPLAESQHAHFW